MKIPWGSTTNIMHASVLLSPFTCIFSFLPLSLSIFVAHPYFLDLWNRHELLISLLILSFFSSSLALYLYLLISSLIPFYLCFYLNRIQIWMSFICQRRIKYIEIFFHCILSCTIFYAKNFSRITIFMPFHLCS